MALLIVFLVIAMFVTAGTFQFKCFSIANRILQTIKSTHYDLWYEIASIKGLHAFSPQTVSKRKDKLFQFKNEGRIKDPEIIYDIDNLGKYTKWLYISVIPIVLLFIFIGIMIIIG